MQSIRLGLLSTVPEERGENSSTLSSAVATTASRKFIPPDSVATGRSRCHSCLKTGRWCGQPSRSSLWGSSQGRLLLKMSQLLQPSRRLYLDHRYYSLSGQANGREEGHGVSGKLLEAAERKATNCLLRRIFLFLG